MVARTQQTFDIKYPAAFGAGLTAALLCLVARQGTLPALLIACLTPLPIMIATLGFGWAPGLSAIAVGSGTIGLYTALRHGEPLTAALLAAVIFGATFAVVFALPAWWLARLARLRKTLAEVRWHDSEPATIAEKAALRSFYPLSRILTYAVCTAATILALALLLISLNDGGFDSLVDRWAAAIAPEILDVASTHELPAGLDLQALARLYVRLMPPVATSFYLLILVGNLWLAGRIVQVSNLLVRPWPDIAGELRLPRALALGFLASLAFCVLDGLAGALASCVAAALGTGFALAGLAVTHVLTRGLKYRPVLLAAIYVTTAIVSFPIFVPFAVLGVLDAWFGFRERAPGTLAPKT